jgi:broad specificity phosphatase PhoE
MFQFTLLRHAQSQANVEAIYQGQSNTSLSEKGRLQAQRLADRWQVEGRHFDGIFASALTRASQTADIANQALQAPIDYDMLWAERDLGQLTGINHVDAPQLMPPPPFVNPFTPYGNTGEGQWDLFLRAGQGLKILLRQAPGAYLLVSHRAFLGMLMYTIFGIHPQANFHGPRFHFKNTGLTEITYNPANHQWRLHSFNDTAHLAGMDDERHT